MAALKLIALQFFGNKLSWNQLNNVVLKSTRSAPFVLLKYHNVPVKIKRSTELEQISTQIYSEKRLKRALPEPKYERKKVNKKKGKNRSRAKTRKIFAQQQRYVFR